LACTLPAQLHTGLSIRDERGIRETLKEKGMAAVRRFHSLAVMNVCAHPALPLNFRSLLVFAMHVLPAGPRM